MKRSSLTILICPLDWGLGHATRCIPIIKNLKKAGHNVIIGSYGQSAELLKRQFPDLKHVHIPFKEVKYSNSLGMFTTIAFQFPKIASGFLKENLLIKKIVKQLNPDVLISDSRFGVYHKQIHSILIIHQLILKCPTWIKWLEPLTATSIKKRLKNFDQIWIPDISGEKCLAGDLSQQKLSHPNVRFIGPLSRFSKLEPINKEKKILALISGPEPYRTNLEIKLRKQLENLKTPYTLLLGQPQNTNNPETTPYGTIYPHMASEKIGRLLNDASIVISRAGYSTIMDLYAVGKSALLIPTPGQTEQEYLASHLNKGGHFLMVPEEKLDLKIQIPQIKSLTPPSPTTPNKEIHKLLITNN